MKETEITEDLIKKSDIFEHFMNFTHLKNRYNEYYRPIVLKCFFLVWIIPNDFNKVKELIEYEIKLHKDMKYEKIIELLEKYQVIFVNLRNNNKLFENKEIFNQINKEYQIYIHGKNWVYYYINYRMMLLMYIYQ